jgi:hypothetical protein
MYAVVLTTTYKLDPRLRGQLKKEITVKREDKLIETPN